MERTERHTAFALWFEQEFVRRGWNQSEVAERLGLSHNAIGKWINQGTMPGRPTCYKIADLYGVPVEEVLERALHSTKPVVIPPDPSVGRLHTTTITPATPESLETRSDAVKRAMAAVAQAMKALEEAQSALDATQTPDD